jgi:hypothetical protein
MYEDRSYDRVEAILAYRPKFLSISVSALGGRGNGATSRVMASEVGGGGEQSGRSGGERLCEGTQFHRLRTSSERFQSQHSQHINSWNPECLEDPERPRCASPPLLSLFAQSL